MAEMDDMAVTPEMAVGAGSNLRRSYMGRKSSSNSGEKLLPHYLRASTGSCHDFCKYGRKHGFEANAVSPMPKKVMRKSFDGESSVDNEVLHGGKKASFTQDKAKFSSISRFSEADATIFIRHEVSTKSRTCSSRMQRDVPGEKKKNLLAKPRSQTTNTPNILKQAASSTTRNLEDSTKKILPIDIERKLPEKSDKILKPKSMKVKALRSTGPRSQTTNTPNILKQAVSSTTRNLEDSMKKILLKGMDRKLPEKSDKILKPKSMKVKALRSTDSLNNLRRKDNSKMGNSFGIKAAKEVVASSKVSSSPDARVAHLTARKHSNPKTIPPKTHSKVRRSEPEQVQSEDAEEKTLYVIKIENEEKTQQPDQNGTDDNLEAESLSPKSSSLLTSPSSLLHEEDHDGSEYTESEAEDGFYTEDSEFDNMEAEKTSSGSCKGRSQNLGTLQSKEKDPQSIKLNFRRGKVIDIRSENNSPRRLKFRRGRLLGENQKNVDGIRKNFKRGKEVDCDTNATEASPETVVLRHQDVQGKKDAQGLFNNVIEETASKLVETRKSKVKALVGAFETVISLQDSKSSPDTVT